MKIAIYGLESQQVQLPYVFPLFDVLKEKGVDFQVENKYYQYLSKQEGFRYSGLETFSTKQKLDTEFDLLFAFGGDGTILSAVDFVLDSNVPIVGINTGRLGFLASINKDVFLSKIDSFLSGDYDISERTLIEATISNTSSNSTSYYALNEVAVNRKETTSMIVVNAYIEDELLNAYHADGLVVSTPTGSTGYSLSCGGPIISPDNEVMVIAPIAAHNMNVRPLVISDKIVIDLEVDSRVNYFSFSVDSRLHTFSTDTKITLSRAPFKINLVQQKQTSYLDTLKQKLLWGSDKRNSLKEN